MEGLDSCGTQ